MAPASGEVGVRLGLLRSRPFRRWLKEQEAKQEGRLSVDFFEDKGLFRSSFHVRIGGPMMLVKGWLFATCDMLYEWGTTDGHVLWGER